MTSFTRILAAALAAGIALFAGCAEDPTSPSAIAGRYQYTAYNAGDTAVVIGSVIINNRDSTLLTGNWTLAGINGATDVGPQIGGGALGGSTASGVSINLNPGWADNNVILHGAFTGNEITGTWSWISFVGVTAEGRFVMKKR
jgi:hypothetical protein